MELTGTIKVIAKTQQVSASFKKRDLVIITDDQYPQSLLIEFLQDKADLLDNFAEGQKVDVSINLAGREWVNPQGETKYFNSIRGWKIFENKDGSNASSQQNQSATEQYHNKQNDIQKDQVEEENDDLPF